MSHKYQGKKDNPLYFDIHDSHDACSVISVLTGSLSAGEAFSLSGSGLETAAPILIKEKEKNTKYDGCGGKGKVAKRIL